MKKISLVPPEMTSKPETLTNMATQHNPMFCNRKFDLEGMDLGNGKDIVVIGVSEEKRLNIGAFYFAVEAYLCWSTVTNNYKNQSLLGLNFLRT